MSRKTVYDAQRILDFLTKSKGEAGDLLSKIRQGQRELFRLESLTAQAVRGDVMGVLSLLSRMGPIGFFALLGYRAITVLTEEKPTEVYFWRYPQ